MKKLMLLFLLPLQMIAQPLQVQSPVRFLALGDSYTIGQSVPASQNWPNQLKDSLAVRNITTDTLRIIATTGWRTDDLLNAITNEGLDSIHFNLVGLLIGVNNQYQGRPISQYITEFPQLVDSAIRYAGGDTSRVFIVSIPDYAYTPFGLQAGDTAQISMQIDTYNLINKQFADSFHIRYFNITPISRQGLNQPDLVTTDGLHPSGLQYAMWVKLMLQTIDSMNNISTSIKDVASNNIISVYPNPVNDELTIHVRQLYPGITFQLFNVLGNQVLNEPLEYTTTTIPLSIAAGCYTVKISSANEQLPSVYKLVKN